MKMYNGILGTVGVHTFYSHQAGAKHVLGEAMARTGNYYKYRIISENKQPYCTCIKYEVFE